MSDVERVFWTVLFRMASRMFVFFTPSDSSLVKPGMYVESLVLLLWNWFERLFSLSFPGSWDGLWSLDGSCICHFSPAPSSLPSFHSCPWLSCIPSLRIHINFFSLSKARPSGLRAMKVSMSVRVVEVDGVGDVVFFDVFSEFDPILARS